MVTEEGDVRKLMFQSETGLTEESRLSLADPLKPSLHYVQQMLALLAVWESQKTSPQGHYRFLVVGLGGASLSNALATIFPEAEIRSVEIEPVVVEAAKKFFFYRESEKVTTIVADARAHLEATTDTYDAIFLDAFDGVGVPSGLRTVEFVQLLEHRLRPEGAVIANIHFTPREPSLRYQKSLRAIFPHVYLTTSGVAQGIGLYTRTPVSSFRLRQESQEWVSRYELPLLKLLSGRHQESLKGVQPFRDEKESPIPASRD